MTESHDPIFPLDLKRSPLQARNRIRGLHQEIRGGILDGRLAPGLRLPSTRAMAGHLGVSRNTVVAVYELLLNEGYIVSRTGQGAFVSQSLARAEPQASAATDAEVKGRLNGVWRSRQPIPAHRPGPKLNFRVGTPDVGLFPHEVWRSLVNREQRGIARERRGYDEPMGRPALRAAIATHASITRAVASAPDDVVVVNGAQQGFDLLARILIEPGRTVVAVEDPGYPPMRAAFEVAGAVVRPIPVDLEGLVVSALPSDTRVICVTPSHQFSLGVPMSLRRRADLLAFASANDAIVIEDDYDGEFRFGARPLDALQTLDADQRVFYLGTFSKCMLPNLRLGFVVAPRWARNALASAKQLADGSTAAAPQEALAAFIVEGHLARHIRRMTRIYGQRRSLLLERLAERCGDTLEAIPAAAGLHVSARFAQPRDGRQLAAAAAEMGVGVRALSEYALAPIGRDGLVFAYGAADIAMIEEATTRLGRLLDAG